MSNQIFDKTAAVAAELRECGHHVEITTHPTSWGNSAYLKAWRTVDGGSCTSGFRLSDHDVGERRKETDDFCTIIDSDSVTVCDLVEFAKIDETRLAQLQSRIAARREQEAKEEARKIAAAKAKAAADAEREKYAITMVSARNAFVAKHHPDFNSLTKTKQRKIVSSFNKNYRAGNAF